MFENLINNNSETNNKEVSENLLGFKSLIRDTVDLKEQRYCLSHTETVPNCSKSLPPNKFIPQNKTTESPKSKVRNWLSGIIDRHGESYIYNSLTSEEVGKNADRIIDEIINGRIDYKIQGKYYTHNVIIDTLINYCSNKLSILKATKFALSYLYMDYSSIGNLRTDSERYNILGSINDNMWRNITQTMIITDQDIFKYELLYRSLSSMSNTQNITILMAIPSQLAAYKKLARNRY